MGDTTHDCYSGDEAHFKTPEVFLSPGATLRCAPCGSEDTELVHSQGAGSIIGSWHEIEVRCRACGKFTAEVTEYDS